jgi:hypothetical protein
MDHGPEGLPYLASSIGAMVFSWSDMMASSFSSTYSFAMYAFVRSCRHPAKRLCDDSVATSFGRSPKSLTTSHQAMVASSRHHLRPKSVAFRAP